MKKEDKAKQIAYFAKNQTEAKNTDKKTLVISDPKQAFIGMSIAASNQDTDVVFVGEAKEVVDECMANIKDVRSGEKN